MTSLPIAAPRVGLSRALALGVLCGVLAAFVLAMSIRTPSPSLAFSAGLIGMGAVAGWMFLSERFAVTLAVLALYLGLLDGFLKLSTGSTFATLGRDVLLYAIVGGALARFSLNRRPIQLPPLSGWVLAFVMVVVVSVFNPGSYPFFGHAIPSIRPHLEFVPLFVLGYLVMRSERRLRGFLVLLLVCGAANGIVNVVQFNLEPAQLASWGPGYDRFINGGDGLAGRTFSTSEGDRVRPFGLASDAGGGGVIAALALPAAIALIGQAWRRPLYAIAASALSIGIVAGVVASQGRGVVVAGFVMVVAYALLSVTPKRLVPTLAGLAVGACIALVVVDAVGGSAGSGAFERYQSIAPEKVLTTTGQDRGGALAVVPEYIRDYPLGHGLGTGGPATGFGGAEKQDLSAESEFSFLVLEVGVLGLVILVGFTVRVLHLALTGIRRIREPELHALLAAVAAPLFGVFALYVTGPATSGSPLAPYLWFVAGTLSYWLVARRGQPSQGMAA